MTRALPILAALVLLAGCFPASIPGLAGSAPQLPTITAAGDVIITNSDTRSTPAESAGQPPAAPADAGRHAGMPCDCDGVYSRGWNDGKWAAEEAFGDASK